MTPGSKASIFNGTEPNCILETSLVYNYNVKIVNVSGVSYTAH